jgi:hypothetical protein
LFRATAWTLGFGLVAIAIAFIARSSPSPAWIPTAVATVGVVALFAWNLGFVHGKVLQGLAISAAPTRNLVGAVQRSNVHELRVDPTIKVVGFIGLQYWLPQVNVVHATAKTIQCKGGLTVSRNSDPRSGEEYVESIGPYSLFRGTVACPA